MDFIAELIRSVPDILAGGLGGYLTARRGKLFWLGVVILALYILSMAGVSLGEGMLGLPPVLGVLSGFLAALAGYKKYKKEAAAKQSETAV